MPPIIHRFLAHGRRVEEVEVAKVDSILRGTFQVGILDRISRIIGVCNYACWFPSVWVCTSSQPVVTTDIDLPC